MVCFIAGFYPLFKCLEDSSLEEVQMLIKFGVGPHCQVNDYVSCLHHLRDGENSPDKPKIAEILLALGKLKNEREIPVFFPLHLSSKGRFMANQIQRAKGKGYLKWTHWVVS